MIKYDKIGPEKVIQVYDSKSGMRGILVVDNTKRGVGKGGIRMVNDISVEEVAGLARAMTYKTALADLPLGGAKGGIIANSKDLNKEEKEKMIRAYAKSLKSLVPDYYVSAPDMYTNSDDMDVFADEIGNKKACTGKSKKNGGIPHELGSTGFGVVESIKVALDFFNLKPSNVSVVVEGFGEVGTATCEFLSKLGVRIIAVSDSKGVIYNEDGLDIDKLKEIKKKGSVINYGDGKILKNEELFGLKSDILIPGARPNVITKDNFDKVKAKFIIEAANIPMDFELEENFFAKGVVVLPDFLCNAGGLISSYVEYICGNEEDAFKMISEKIAKNTLLVLQKSKEKEISPRKVAMEIAEERLNLK